MINKISLTEDQKNLLRQAISKQLESLERVITGDSTEDITMYSIQNGVSKETIITNAKDSYQLFKEVHDNPERLFSLGYHELNKIRHILVNFFAHEGQVFAEIWSKILVFDSLTLIKPN